MSDWDSTTTASPAGAIRGGAAIAMAKIARRMMVFLSTVLLARLLTPQEFGAVAIVAAFLALGLVLQEAGLSSATIQRERVTTEAVSTMFWINLSLGFVLTLLFAALAHPIAGFFGQPELVSLCRAMSVTFLLNGAMAQHRALLQRSMRFMTTARIDVVSALAGGGCAVAFAVSGFGVWALVAQMLISDALALLMLVMVLRWRLTRPALTTEVRQMLVFGLSMLGFNVVVTIAFNIQALLLGRSVGVAAAGIYTRAYALSSIPQTLLQSAAGHVALARLSRAQRDETGFSAFYLGGVRLLSLVTLPVVLAFAVFGDEVASMVYGSQWDGVSDLLRILAIGLAVTPLLHSTGPVFVARGEPHRMLRWGVFGASVTVLGSVVGLRWGTIGVASGWSASMLVLLVPCLGYAFRDTDLSLGRVAGAVAGIYAAAGCALPVGWAARQALSGLPDPVVFALAWVMSVLVYLALCYWVFGQKVVIRNVVERLLPKSEGTPTGRIE